MHVLSKRMKVEGGPKGRNKGSWCCFSLGLPSSYLGSEGMGERGKERRVCLVRCGNQRGGFL